jgi:pentatricopeptide repeat-containing protein PET309
MLERAPSCLEQGGRRLLDVSRKSIRSRRYLHSAFWSHGAGEIDLPSWWIALLAQPPPEHSTSRRSIVDSSKSFSAAELGDAGFLDFLYPAKTLKLVHKLAVQDPGLLRQRCGFQLPASTRGYSTEATAERVPTQGGSAHAAQLVDALRKIEEVDNPDAERGRLATRGRIYREDCTKIVEDSDHLLELSDKNLPEVVARLSMLKSRGSNLLRDHSEYLVQRLEATFKHRAQWQPKHYAMSITAHILCKKYDIAMDLYREALGNFQDHIASTLIIRLAMEQKAWQLATEAWVAYGETVQSESFFWSGLQDMDCHQLFRHAIELADFVVQSKHNADTFLRQFTIKLLESIFSLRDLKDFNVPAFDHYSLFMRLRNLVRKPTEQQYRMAIDQCLSISFAPRDPKLRAFGDTAIRLYMQMRNRDEIVPDQKMLESLLKRSCHTQNVDTKLIFADLKNHYGAPTKLIYTIMIKYWERLNDPRACYRLMEEAETQHGNMMTSGLALRLLRMHAQRKEMSQAIRLFSSLRERTGESPGPAHWNAMVLAHTRVNDIAGARKWLDVMRKRGIQPDFHTFVPLLKHFSRRGDTDAVHGVVRDMRFARVDSHVAVIEALIQSYIQNEDLDEAHDLLFEAQGMDLQGDRTNMWNLLLTAFAVRRSIAEVDYLRKSMEEAQVPANEMTFAALASALCAQRQPVSAFRLIRRTMRLENLKPMALHFSIVMGGFINTAQYDQVFVVYRWMVEHGIAPDLGAKSLLVRAAAMIDQQEAKQDHTRSANRDTEGVVLSRAEEMLEQLLESAAPSDVPRNTPVKGLSWDASEESYASNYFDFLIYSYGHARMFSRVEAMYDKYVKHVQRNSTKQIGAEVPLPMRMLVALMVYHRKAESHAEVERLWNYAVERSQPLVIREGANPSNDDWVLPSRQYILATPLAHYMRSLADTERAGEFDQLFQYLTAMGYGLDSKAWNFYVQEAGFANDHLRAFVTAEQRLMQNWQGWAPGTGRHKSVVLDKIRKQGQRSLQRGKWYPTYKTLVILARSFLEVQSRSAYSDEYDKLLKQIEKQAPITARAVLEMPPLDEKLQQTYLRRG